jgi:hypothetical protein
MGRDRQTKNSLHYFRSRTSADFAPLVYPLRLIYSASVHADNDEMLKFPGGELVFGCISEYSGQSQLPVEVPNLRGGN